VFVLLVLCCVSGRSEAVWPSAQCGGLVVVLVLAEHGGGVPLVDDQGAVEEFASDAATKRSVLALARSVRTGVRRMRRVCPESTKLGADPSGVGSASEGTHRLLDARSG
jgi:hypothetical protein